MHIYPDRAFFRQRGFTLMELMVVLALAAIIMSLAVPNFSAFMRNSRLTSGANDLLAALTMARTEAIKRQVPVAVCATTAPTVYPPVCNGSWSSGTGWVVWVDADNDWTPDNDTVNEPVLLSHAALDSTITVRGNFSGRVKYLSTGFAAAPAGGFTSTSEIAICDARGTASAGNAGSAARAIRLSQTGRPRVTRIVSEVNASLTAIGATCP